MAYLEEKLNGIEMSVIWLINHRNNENTSIV